MKDPFVFPSRVALDSTHVENEAVGIQAMLTLFSYHFLSADGLFFDYAMRNLSPLPNVPSFELSTCFEYSRGNSFCTLIVDASGHAVHGMNKHVRF